MKIVFDTYTAEDARQEIAIFRRTLPRSVQRGWSRFWILAWRLFDRPETPEIAAADKARLRRRMDLIFLVSAVVVLVVCATAGLILARWPLLIVPVFLVPMWLIFRNSQTPRSGARLRSHTERGNEAER